MRKQLITSSVLNSLKPEVNLASLETSYVPCFMNTDCNRLWLGVEHDYIVFVVKKMSISFLHSLKSFYKLP
jgi:hypothetical protein